MWLKLCRCLYQLWNGGISHVSNVFLFSRVMYPVWDPISMIFNLIQFNLIHFMSECGTAQLRLSFYFLFSCYNRYCHWVGWARQYVAFNKLIHLNDPPDDVTFIFSTLQRPSNYPQTWKRARTRGHCPRKFLIIVEISGLWKIYYSYFGIKLMNCENFFLNIKYLAYL